MEHGSGIVGFVLGTMAAQFAGAWTYRTAKRRLALGEVKAAITSGLATAVVAASAYIPFDVHEWLGGRGVSWDVSVFMAVCMGIAQAVLFRGRPLEPRA
jgi:hypothetical protein